MNTDKIKELINSSDLNQLQKNVTNGFIDRANNYEIERQLDRDLIEKVAKETKLKSVILSTEDVKIYTVYGKDEWSIKYPFRSIYLNKDGKWVRCNAVAPNLDTAFIIYLEQKYLGMNSRFSDFALKMLEIKIDN